MVGGECNYLLRVDSKTGHLAFVPDREWKSPYMMSWSEGDIQDLLRGAERVLMETANRLRLPVKVRVLSLSDSSKYLGFWSLRHYSKVPANLRGCLHT